MEGLGVVFNVKTSPHEKYKKASDLRNQYTQKEKDQFCRKEQMLTTKIKDHQSFFNKGMAMNKVLMDVVTGGTTRAKDLEIKYPRKPQM